MAVLCSFPLLFTSCDDDDDNNPKESAETPDVTQFGVTLPLVMYNFYDSDGYSRQYNLSYTADNRLNGLSGEKWSMRLSPLTFVYNGRDYLGNFKYNNKGFTTYFEVLYDNQCVRSVSLAYNSSYQLSELIETIKSDNSKSRKVFSYDVQGRLVSIYDYYKDELSSKTLYEYSNKSVKNTDALYVSWLFRFV